MPSTNHLRIAVFPGDGIGPEVMGPCLDLVRDIVGRTGGFDLAFTELPAGAAHYRDTGMALPDASLRQAADADAILLGAMGLPAVRYEDGTEISPQLDLRIQFNLYAGVRPVRVVPGLPMPLADGRAEEIDFVIVRESTEGLFASRGAGTIDDDTIARDTMVITRPVSERLFDFSFRLAQQRRDKKPANDRSARVTCVDKANVFRSFAFFRKIFDERATHFPDIAADHAYIDATALNLVRRPWEFDVMVTENMFGDILSDLGAGLIGGMGMAPSADIGDEHAVFQPSHGSAPDILGLGKANPTAMFLSAALMLDWLGDRFDEPACHRAATLLTRAVDTAFAAGNLLPTELGGTAGTKAITKAVFEALPVAQSGLVEPAGGTALL